jgi:hypothetical protein
MGYAIRADEKPTKFRTETQMRQYILNTRQYTSDRDVVKIVCRRSLGFYREITCSVIHQWILAVEKTAQDNGKFPEDEDADNLGSDNY